MPLPKGVKFLKAKNSKWSPKCVKNEFPLTYHIVMDNIWFLGGVGSKNPFHEFLRKFEVYSTDKSKMAAVVLNKIIFIYHLDLCNLWFLYDCGFRNVFISHTTTKIITVFLFIKKESWFFTKLICAIFSFLDSSSCAFYVVNQYLAPKDKMAEAFPRLNEFVEEFL